MSEKCAGGAQADRITLTLPAKSEYILAVRLFMSGVATRVGFSVEQIEDVRTAVSEACVYVLKDACRGTLALCVQADESKLCVRAELRDAQKDGVCAEVDAAARELSQLIIEALAQHAILCENSVELVFEGKRIGKVD